MVLSWLCAIKMKNGLDSGSHGPAEETIFTSARDFRAF